MTEVAGSRYRPLNLGRYREGPGLTWEGLGQGVELGVRDTAAMCRLTHRARAPGEDKRGLRAGRWCPEQASQGDCELSCRSPSQRSAAAGLGGGAVRRGCW